MRSQSIDHVDPIHEAKQTTPPRTTGAQPPEKAAPQHHSRIEQGCNIVVCLAQNPGLSALEVARHEG